MHEIWFEHRHCNVTENWKYRAKIQLLLKRDRNKSLKQRGNTSGLWYNTIHTVRSVGPVRFPDTGLNYLSPQDKV